jgi:hypothetical protein
MAFYLIFGANANSESFIFAGWRAWVRYHDKVTHTITSYSSWEWHQRSCPNYHIMWPLGCIGPDSRENALLFPPTLPTCECNGICEGSGLRHDNNYTLPQAFHNIPMALLYGSCILGCQNIWYKRSQWGSGDCECLYGRYLTRIKPTSWNPLGWTILGLVSKVDSVYR